MKQKGYSLIEITLALFLIAVIIGLGSISFLHTSPKYKLLNAVREIHSRMNYARYKAIFSGNKIRLRFEPDNYAIERYDASEEQWIREMIHFLEGVNVEANNTPTFHPRGTVSNLTSILVFNSWGKYKISLAISGRIKVTKL